MDTISRISTLISGSASLRKRIQVLLLAAGQVFGSTLVGHAQNAAVEEALSVPGARATIPVAAAKEAFTKEFIEEAFGAYNSFHAQMGGDHTLYYLMNWSSLLRTDMSMPHPEQIPLERALDERIGLISVKTQSAGELTLDEYVEHEVFRLQGLMMIHKGAVVYEAYPGMSPTDMHWWASASKTISGLLTAILVEEGGLETNRPVPDYVPWLAGTAWDDVRVTDLIHHTSGLDIEETNDSILDPNSIFVRHAAAALASPDRSVEIEDWRQVLREAEPLEGEQPGELFRYSSLNTQVLGQVIEGVTGLRFADVVEERIWGRMGARMPLLTHLAPEGGSLNMAIISSTLEDMARYAVVWTPSWSAAAHEPVVPLAALERIRREGDPEAFRGGKKEEQAMSLFGERPVKASYQFDFIFEDGAMYKHGNMGQGIYIDPERDFVGVYFATTPYVPPHGEIKAPAYIRATAKLLAGE